jgi:hypothetical protein
VNTEITKVIQCNCSICTKKGALHHRVAADQFRLLAGQDELTLYQFGSKAAKHWFCRHCGIHPFSNPRAAPDMVSVNIHCLDDFYAIYDQIDLVPFDGQHWEQAIETFRL